MHHETVDRTADVIAYAYSVQVQGTFTEYWTATIRFPNSNSEPQFLEILNFQFQFPGDPRSISLKELLYIS